jgi:hypothetical protein
MTSMIAEPVALNIAIQSRIEQLRSSQVQRLTARLPRRT